MEQEREGRAPARQSYFFDGHEVDLRSAELRRGGRALDLEPLPVRILGYLAAHPGELVTREELRRFGWPRLPGVADDSLNTCIRQIRDALGDDARSPRFVETLRGRGYRFLPEVTRSASGSEDGGVSRRWRYAAAAVLLVAAGVSSSTFLPGGSVPITGGERPMAAVPAEVRAELVRIDFLAHRGENERALEVARRAAEAFPGRADLHGAEAEFLAVLGRTKEARTAIVASRTAGEDARAYRAEVLLDLLDRRWTSALAAADEAVHLDASAEGFVVRAFARALVGLGEAAVADIERALALDPLSPVVHHDAGLVYLWAGHLARAADMCGEAAELAPELTWARLCEFDAAEAAGDRARAARVARDLLSGRAEPMAVGGNEAVGGPHAADPVDALWRWRLAQAEERGSLYERAVALSAMGRTAEAVAALRQAVDQGGFGVLAAAVDPRLAALRGQEGYRAVLSRLGLERRGGGASLLVAEGGTG